MAERPTVAVVGAGPAGLIAAERLAQAGAAVTVHERMPSVARKFLMAGRGGLNLTHSEPLDQFLSRYGESRARLAPMIEAFPPDVLRAWAEGLGAETFVGSSGRVFPKAMKASPLLRAWLARLDRLGVKVRTRTAWTGWDPGGRPLFVGEGGGAEPVAADALLLALGGASWPRLGSDGGWAPLLAERGVALAPFWPSNAGVEIAWSAPFRDRFAGQPVKPLAAGVAEHRSRGEAMVTGYGLEGGAIYALSAPLREAMANGPAELTLDLAPDQTVEGLAQRLARGRVGDAVTNRLRKAGLSPVAIGLMREARGVALPPEPMRLARVAKGARLKVVAMRGLDRAISSAGGVTWEAVGDGMELKALPGVFVAGEMLDWEAPTGGYLLQACFATGVAAAGGIARRLGLQTRS